MPTIRGGLGVAVGNDNRIYAVGGVNRTTGYLSTNEAYNVTGGWSTVTSMPTPRAQLGVTAGLDGRVFAIGGVNSSGHPAAVEAYSPSSDTWSTLAPLPQAREDVGAATGLDGRVYAVAGEGLTRVDRYDPSSNAWSPIAPLPTARDAMGTAVGPDGRIYVAGGLTYGQGGGIVETNLFQVYDPRTDSWKTLSPLPTVREFPTAVTGPDGRIYVIGGDTIRDPTGGPSGPKTTVVEAYDPVTGAWDCSTDDTSGLCTAHTIAPMPTARRNFASAVGPDNRIYTFGGATDSSIAVNTVESFAPLKTLSTGTARAGTTATIHGTGYQAGEAVTVKWNCAFPSCSSTRVLGNPTADASGNWSLSFTVPAFSAGGYPISARGNTSSTFAARDFIVAPAATLSSTPSTAPGNATATLTGTNFTPGETVTIKWNCGSIDCTSHYTLLPTGERSFQGVRVLGTATADSSGNFTHAFTVPNFSPGSYPIGAIGSTSNSFAKSTFTVAAPATLTLTPSSGHPGSGYSASGTGFQSGETVTVKFNCSAQSCSSLQTLGTAAAQPDGTFSIASVTIPNFSARSYPVAAIGGTSNTLATTTFTIN